MDNINKMFTVLCVLIMSIMVGGLAEHCGGLGGGGVSAPAPPSGGLGSIISKATFNKMLKHRNDSNCPAKGFYTYEAFIQAAKLYPAFGNTGSITIRKREVAAFFGQTSHETADYCYNRELQRRTYCQRSTQYPCAPGKQYYGRGPMQLTWNYNYGMCGKAIKADLLKNPDLVATDRVITFKAALWFWMTTQKPKPSCHDVITGKWKPTAADKAARRLPGYGVTTNIINGGECGRGPDKRVADRIRFYKEYCGMLGVSTGPNIDCYSQKPFGSSSQIDLVSSV